MSFDAAALADFPDGIDLNRSGVFTTQRTWRWCTAADVQIIRNIVDHHSDHLAREPGALLRLHAGAQPLRDPGRRRRPPPAGRRGLRHFVDAGYRRVASSTLRKALRSAVSDLRKTNLPVGITVCTSNRAWVLTGPTATADPAKQSDFHVKSVRVVGPLWGLQSRTPRYYMKPESSRAPVQGVLHALALRRDPDGVGGPLGLDPGRPDVDSGRSGGSGDHGREGHAEADGQPDTGTDATPVPTPSPTLAPSDTTGLAARSRQPSPGRFPARLPLWLPCPDRSAPRRDGIHGRYSRSRALCCSSLRPPSLLGPARNTGVRASAAARTGGTAPRRTS